MMLAHIFRTGLKAVAMLLILHTGAGVACAASDNTPTLTDALEELPTLAREADNARRAVDAAVASGKEYGELESDWMQREARLESARVRVFARMVDAPEQAVVDARRAGWGWERLLRRHHIPLQTFHYGRSPFDVQRDTWRHTLSGFTSREGLPPAALRHTGQSRGSHDAFVRPPQTPPRVSPLLRNTQPTGQPRFNHPGEHPRKYETSRHPNGDLGRRRPTHNGAFLPEAAETQPPPTHSGKFEKRVPHP